VPDPRVDALAELYQPPKITFATVEYIDVPAISKETLRDPAYLASLRVVDAFAHVLRVFQDETVPHEHGSVDPARDFDDVETELILSDLVVVEKRLERVGKTARSKNPELDKEYELLVRCKEALESNTPLRNLEFDKEDEKRIRGFQFLSQKPMLLVLNLGEEDAARLHEVEEKYRTGPLAGKAQHGSDGGLRQDRSGTGGTSGRRCARVSASYGLKESACSALSPPLTGCSG
jgi:ribosome-binding ATPase